MWPLGSNECVPTVVQFCNDLAHHKMYPLFLGLGYAARSSSAKRTRLLQEFIDATLADVKKLFEDKKAVGRLLLLGMYFTVNNPHDTKEANRTKLIEVVGADTVAALDKILKDWKDKDEKDYCPYLAGMLRVCGIKDWSFGKTLETMFKS